MIVARIFYSLSVLCLIPTAFVLAFGASSIVALSAFLLFLLGFVFMVAGIVVSAFCNKPLKNSDN